MKLEDQSDNYFTINAPTPTVSICSPITIDGITYSLNPCTITETMVDGQGNKNFSTTILSSNRLYSFSKRGYGEGFPVYSILGVSSGGGQGNTPVGLYFNDQVLSANGNLPKTYTGYLPIHIFHGSEGNDNNYLYLGVNLTVTPPPPTPVPDPVTPPPTGFILDSTPRIAGWGRESSSTY